MKLTEFSAVDFRNLRRLRLAPNPQFNIIEGRNGAGKTNVLEGIFLLSSLKTFRPGKNKDLVRFGTQSGEVRAVVEHQDTTRTIRISISPKGRRVWIDGKLVRSAASALGQLTAVLFAPEDLSLTKGSPSGRRRFLDRAIFNRWPGSLDAVKRYESALKQRNALLRTDGSDALLEVFDEQLARAALRLSQWRQKYIGIFHPILEETMQLITGGDLQTTVMYEPSRLADTHDQWVDIYRKNRRQDRARKSTTAGPHVDDICLLLNDRSAKLYASQGQHRALVLALKIAEIRLLKQELGYAPVLLLDDVSSELDARRNAQLTTFLNSEAFGGQVFITTTDRSWLDFDSKSTCFRIRDGDTSEH